MQGPVFCDVTPENLTLLETALAQLAADLGDPYRAGNDTLHAALFASPPVCHGVLALGADQALLGAALFSPVMSTSAGGAGVFVSDLWVARSARGQSVGRELLHQVAGRAHALWDARFMRLVSYGTNPAAGAFYARLGFSEKPDDMVLQIGGTAFEKLSR